MGSPIRFLIASDSARFSVANDRAQTKPKFDSIGIRLGDIRTPITRSHSGTFDLLRRVRDVAQAYPRLDPSVLVAPSSSVSVGASVNDHTRTEQNLQIEPNAPVADVPKVQIYAALHCLQPSGFAARTADLGPARNTRFDPLSKRVVGDRLGILAIMSEGMRARPYQ